MYRGEGVLYNSINELCDKSNNYKIVGRKIKYINIPCSFDIETTSALYNDEKVAFMYIWMLGINGNWIYGRTWTSFIETINYLIQFYHLSDSQHLIIYVHNLSYEFQFMKTFFKWDNVFATEERKVLKAEYKGVEFRCSYLLSGHSLNQVAKNLYKYKCEKMVGDLDYNLIRSQFTPLTDKELGYCKNDVIIVMNYIQELIEHYGNIAKLPLTQTGFIRKLLKQECYKKENYYDFKNKIADIKITSVLEYYQMKRAYIGAFSGANPLALGEEFSDVFSIDITSSYPFEMCTKMFPMSSFKKIELKNIDDFNYYNQNYCTLFDIELFDVVGKHPFCYILSESRCFEVEEAEIINGKIKRAKHLKISLNNIDFETYKNFYSFSKFKITNFRYAIKFYLPKQIIKVILDLFVAKSRLKGVKGEEANYMHSKQNINSCYGAMVTDITRAEISYETDTDEWHTKDLSTEEICDILDKYNNNEYNPLKFHWGMFVTSYAKKHQTDMILKIGYDFLYTDTDSIKALNYSKYKTIIDADNKKAKKLLDNVIDTYKLDKKYKKILDSKGNVQQLGTWTFEETYKKFKTLGSKKYFYQNEDNTFEFTIAGLNKKIGLGYICDGLCQNLKTKKLNFNPLDKFKNDLVIPEKFTGKLTHTYIDDAHEGYLIDYLGKRFKFKSPSGVHLGSCSFSMKLEDAIVNQVLYNLRLEEESE